MASPKSTELSATELELKRRGRRRLIGAITLGLLIVVFLPMLFDAEPNRDKAMSQEISIQLPSKDSLAPLPAPMAMPSSPPVGPAAAVKPAESSPLRDKAGSTAEPAKKTAENVAPPIKDAAKPVAAAPKPEPKPAKSADLKHGFVVQIGAFKDADNAQQTAARMKDAKLPVYTDSVATKSGTVTRVRVGPFSHKEQADVALAQVKLAGADGKIVPLP